MTEDNVKGMTVPQNSGERRMEEWKSPDITELIKALVTFQGGLASVGKGKTNPFFGSSYADINDILIAIRPELMKSGLAITQGNRYCTDSNGFYVTTMLVHSSGQWLKSEVRMPIGGKKDSQAVGSSITYGRRYGLSAILGISVEADDDGNKAIKQ
jgi:hypothetical protein